MSDRSEFETFLTTFLAAARAGDADFARATLPPGLPEDHFAFLMNMREGMVEEIDQYKAVPEIEFGAEKSIVRYSWTSPEEGETKMEMPFYRHEGRWVTFDPNDPEMA